MFEIHSIHDALRRHHHATHFLGSSPSTNVASAFLPHEYSGPESTYTGGAGRRRLLGDQLDRPSRTSSNELQLPQPIDLTSRARDASAGNSIKNISY